MRQGVINRITTETQIKLKLGIEGQGRYQISTGIRFFDHMLELFTRHGAFDLTLVWEDGEPLFMGGLFDDASAVSHTDRFEGPGPAADFSFSAEEARANRRLLFWVMTEAGFVNYPDEWWHYSWGDQMWAALTGAPAAFYAAAPGPAT